MKKVAIIGYASRLPQCRDKGSFWQHLLMGDDLITQVAEDRWAQEYLQHPQRSHPGTSVTFAAGSLGEVSGFDAGFFRISPREAAAIDPQQRLLLEMSWEAFAHAGILPDRLRGSRCGVFMGLASTDYASRVADDLAAIGPNTATGSTASIAANRLSYFYDLRGPSFVVDTACSSTLVAFHQACQSILHGETDLALTGAISLHLHPYGFLIFSKASMLSKRGRCRPFDASADGYVRSEGGGMFILKDHAQALRDGDRILAVVAHSAINTDGHKSGLTIPSVGAQQSLLEQAYAAAGIDPRQLDYLEAHGTGTPVGDPIEVEAIGRALGMHREADQPLPIGSVKSNIGHLETASGIPGLLKSILVLQNRLIPPTIGIETLNPRLALDDYHLEVVQRMRPLRAEGSLLVGVNSFGFGGANAHIILESAEAPRRRRSPRWRTAADGRKPLCLSAATPSALQAVAQDFADWLTAADHEKLYAALYQANFRRAWLAQRVIFWLNPQEDMAAQLRAFADGQSDSIAALAMEKIQGPVFVYSGNGSQWAGMGQALLQDPVFASAIAEVDHHFAPLAGYTLQNELAGCLGDDRYIATEQAQPALFALQVGITAMLRAQGIVAAAVAGHSVGEVAAAWACGALTLAEAVLVIYERSRLQGQSRGQGQMTAVALSADALLPHLHDWGLDQSISIAAWNSLRGSTVVGSSAALSELEKKLRAQGVGHKRLDIDYPFHSASMDPLQAELMEMLQELKPQATQIPFISAVSGTVLAGEALDADYWWRNIRQPVRFQQAAAVALEQWNLFVEIGGHAVLRGYLQEAITAGGQEGRVIPTLRRNENHPEAIRQTLAALWMAGVEPDWKPYFPVRSALVDLPDYPWEREKHWHKTTPESAGTLYRYAVHPLLGHPVAGHPNEWEQSLDTARQAFLADHQVGDGVVFPGAGFVELALAAAREKLTERQDTQAWTVEELDILLPLLLDSARSKIVRVEVQDGGHFQIRSRKQMENNWVIHAKGRVRLGATQDMAERSLQNSGTTPAPTSMPGEPADFQGEEHYARCQAAGLHYGPVFQTVTQGWLQGTIIHGQLQLSGSAMSETYLLHPALLDGAMQLFVDFLAQSPVPAGWAYVPVRFANLSVFVPGKQTLRVVVEVLRHSPQSLLARLSFWGEAGELVACCDTLRLRRVRLQKPEREKLRYVQSVLRPVPRSEHQHFVAELDQPRIRSIFARHQAGQSALQRYAQEYSPLIHTLLQTYAAESAGHSDPEVAARDIWQMLLQDYPEFFPITLAVGRYGLGTQGEASDYNPDGPLRADLMPVMMDTLSSSLVLCLQDLQSQCLQQLSAAQLLNFMEICSGEPEALALWAENTDPRISLWRAYDSEDAQTQEDKPWQSVQITTNPSAAMHLIWLRLDAAMSEQHWQMLEFAEHCLVPGGLLLVQGVEPENWWSEVDPAASAFPSRTRIQDWLEQRGISLSLALTAGEAAGAYGFIARKSPEQSAFLEQIRTEPAAAVLLCSSPDHNGVESVAACLLENALAAKGLECRHLPWPMEDKLPSSPAPAASAEVKPIAGMIFLPDFADGEDLAEAGESAAIRLRMDCERLQQAGLWSLRQAPIIPLLLLSDGGLGGTAATTAFSATHSLGQAGLCGFARSLQNEWPELKLRIVDWGQGSPETVQMVVEECLSPGPETELLLDVQGGRYILQVQEGAAPESRPAGHDGPEVQPQQVRPSKIQPQIIQPPQIQQLQFSLPGQLRHLQWVDVPEWAPEAHEVEIAVDSAGLNFRDVMYALGLLADEALENGFSGPTLGLEFAGKIRRIGAAVTQWQVGDAVLGFAPASFSTRLMTSEQAITRIPEGLSMRAAATIPTVFLTAWYALHTLARLQAGEKVLIHGAAGGVGIAAIQIAQHLGAEIYATAGSPQKRDFLRLLGVQHIYDSRSLDFADAILADTQGEGVDVLLNSLYGEAVLRNLQILKPFGRFLELGKRDFYENNAIGLRPFRNNLSYFGIDADQLLKGRPQLTQTLFTEIMSRFEAGDFFPLPATHFPAARVTDAFRHMQQARQIGKVVVEMTAPYLPHAPRSEAALRLQLNGEAAYLITGGLGGFGLATAQRLVERGAKKLVLVSRSGQPDPAADLILNDLRAPGVQVHAWSCDVREAPQVQVLIQRITREVGPLHGIIHAAAVIEDALAQNLGAELMDKVIQPKVAGAWNLHQASLHQPLEFFVLYSSMTTVLGNPGQAHYVAANSWMEAFAQWRRQQGLAALAILWGAIADVGYLTRHEKTRDLLQQRLGGAALTASTALDVLENMMVSDAHGWMVADLDWRALQRFLPVAASPRFAAVMPSGKAEAASSDEDLRSHLQSLPTAEAEQLLVETVRREVAQILRLSADKITPDQNLSQLGLDSLMGVELALALEERLGVKLPAFLLSEGPTPLRLARRLVQSLSNEAEQQDVPGAASITREQLEAQHGVT
ncbi:SDR family NAD(P)-dependent oxidoreductase [Acidithiobacillus sulfurivorans]|uniref:Polyketide synthase n=1 Tax=Acidithiobacillus sulfurivorans TaxID=1958756 RepID=A0ABS5ZY60_9PROT|nr:polyketide synthase [Acidithiobacillus sulfurivorans]